ncbi:DUF3618 domain-containing protein [Krasilnikovia sp. MM14-A1259]|uniref:DUF3618 domain-containing protein n=1 Tax=Krasilnikovia sp. MM14-A1259 TaxID=3373539 RepID=UPI0037FB57E3
MSDKNGSPQAKPDVAALREEIAETRADLGDTVRALAAKTDVKARAKEQVQQTGRKVKSQVAETTGKVRDNAQSATDAVREAAQSATGKVRDSGAMDVAHEAGDQVRRHPFPVGAVIAGAVALAGIILIIRRRRR